MGGELIPYRMAPVVQANEPDSGRRAEIEAARNACSRSGSIRSSRGAREVPRRLLGARLAVRTSMRTRTFATLDLRALARGWMNS